MKAGFQNTTLNVRTSDGLCDTLLEPLVFIRRSGEAVRAPVGSSTDGWSVPRCLRNFMPAASGDWFAAVLHDSAYRNQMQTRSYDGSWLTSAYGQYWSDKLLLEAMHAQGIGLVKRYAIYWCVRAFGHTAFAEDRAENNKN